MDNKSFIYDSINRMQFPYTLMKAYEVIIGKNKNIDEVLKLIVKNKVLSQKLSLYFEMDEEFTSKYIEEIIGSKRFAMHAFSLGLIDFFNDINKKYDLSRYWEKALFNATAAFLIADQIKKEDKEILFIAGLMSNISDLYLLDNFPNEFAIIMSHEQESVQRIKNEIKQFGVSHAIISAHILDNLNFTKRIHTPIKYHHELKKEEDFSDKDTYLLSKIIYTASKFTDCLYENVKIFPFLEKILIEEFKISKENIFELFLNINKYLSKIIRAYGLENLRIPCYLDILRNTIDSFIQSENENLKLLVNFKMAKDQSLRLADKLEETNHTLLNIALKDPLTGACNRRFLDERLGEEIAKVKRHGNIQLFIIASDIDHFKKINDTYGHDNGDIILKDIVRIMKSTVRVSDLVARTGGEEFITVCLTKISNNLDGHIIAEKIRKNIAANEFILSDKSKINATMSFGVSLYSDKFKNIKEFLKDADLKLYKAKETGRNKVVF